jgi:glutathione S-transferase
MANTKIALHQFAYSHFNEKARWGLAWKGVPHERVYYLPGPHIPSIRRLSGQAQTPVLVIDDVAIAGSARILDELERRFPERPLYPDEPAHRSRALEIQQRFDTEVGPAARTVVFSVLMNEPDYLCAIFSEPKPWLARKLYRASFPLARRLFAKANGVDNAANIERAFEVTRQALDFVAENAGASGYLVGERFSVADLCCAALLAVLVDPQHPDMCRPHPRPAAIDGLVARWSTHAGTQWVLEQYRRHRDTATTAA